ncbi:NAD-dependent epimerase/dehydratase family protein [Runella slithyformis]|uniref:NAD-dependent epimerase/dehydratase n=1 Tax=Runella slithyformis (strain ATCC 29530 / DSM 19594 / LMG 11500 / NCIMB 11436 / LSU 4) TaxID=761193 RepID=A0A7U3ZG60_RUNSL|nr:NAD-dependent epimerase/dehydratase family protein [Runella slithyformis]AEI46507.1 NAD-dependent epimerase/dehydratase [Runella slithyformis DSM 19594]
MKYSSDSLPIVFITGTNGLIGSAVVRRLLKDGYRVRGGRRLTSDTRLLQGIEAQIEWVDADVLDVTSLEKALQGVTFVIHTAAVVSFVPRDRTQMYDINVNGTANIVNAALAAGIKKMAFVSSVAALGRPDPSKLSEQETAVIDEDQKWEESPLNSHYGKSKYLAELEVWRGVAEGLSAVVVNPSMVLGEGDWSRSSTQLFKYVYDEKKYYTEGLLNYVDVQDVAEAIVTLLFSDISNERYILSAGQVTYRELFTKIATAFGKQPPSKAVSTFMAETIWRVEAVRSWLTGSKPLITKETAKTARTKLVYDGHKITQAIKLTYKPLEETVARVCAEIVKNNR